MAETYGGLFPPTPRVTLLHQDVLSLSPEPFKGKIGLIVTSPPYPNAYEYWLYHKYRMYWLDMDPIALRSGEIGARPHYFKKNHQTEADFEVQMEKVFQLLGKLLPLRAYACFVVGRSIIHGRVVDNVQLLTRAAERAHFTLAGSVSRSIARNRKSFNLSHAAITEETITVFQLAGSTR
jgi:site-specific DNA-methyltransferase (cytosine-N4-specific)